MAEPAPLIARTPMSLDEFWSLDVVLAELVEGQPIFMSSPDIRHQRASRRLARALEDACPTGYEVLTAPMDWVLWELPRATVRQPDLLVVRFEPANRPRVTEPPLLAVEVVSPSSQERDLVAKRRDYARAGCEHYWIVDPDSPLVVCLRRRDGEGYEETTRLTAGVTTLVTQPFPIALDPDDLVADPRR